MDFYQGQTITLINLTGPGTGTDVRGRLFAARFGEYTGTSVTVRNETSREGLQNAFKAVPDGLTLWAMAAGGLMPRGVLGLIGADNRLNDLPMVHVPATSDPVDDLYSPESADRPPNSSSAHDTAF